MPPWCRWSWGPAADAEAQLGRDGGLGSRRASRRPDRRLVAVGAGGKGQTAGAEGTGTDQESAIHARGTEKFAANAAFSAVDVTPTRLSGIRTPVNVVFTFADRASGVADKYSVRVDVTEEFPFLAGGLAPHFDR